MDRLDLNHTLMTKVIGNKLYLAPIAEKAVQRILDIGTGTGICKQAKTRNQSQSNVLKLIV
jgi:hypothetical protein